MVDDDSIDVAQFRDGRAKDLQEQAGASTREAVELSVGLLATGPVRAAPDPLPLVQHGVAAPLAVSDNDWAGVKRAAGDLQADIERVTGVRPALGPSPRDSRQPPALPGPVTSHPPQRPLVLLIGRERLLGSRRRNDHLRPPGKPSRVESLDLLFGQAQQLAPGPPAVPELQSHASQFNGIHV